MPLQLVTGQTGELNVTSENAGAYNAGIVGTGQYIMRGLECKMSNATTLHVGPGVASMNGRNIYLDAAGEDVAVAAGASGQNRNDILVARYAKTGTGESLKESVKFVVVKGTPTSGTPSDPSYTAGTILDNPSTVDMPICRIPIRGVAPGTLEMLSPTVKPLADLWDSVSHVGKTLWSSSGYFMNEGQTAELSNTVSSQHSGIVLVWRGYENGAAIVGSCCTQFIPKSLVSKYNGIGVSTFMTNSSGNVCATKYVYVSDSMIKGNEYNGGGERTTSSGLKVTPNRWVLTDVIGV